MGNGSKVQHQMDS